MVEAEQQEAYPSSQVQYFKPFTTYADVSPFGPDGLTLDFKKKLTFGLQTF